MTKRYKKKKYSKPNNYRRVSGETMAANMGVAGYKLAKKALSYLNVEFKEASVDQNIPVCGPAASVANSQIYCLNGLAQGSGDVQRNGNQVEFKSLSLHGRFAASTSSHILRMIIFKYKGINGQTPTTAEVLNSASAPVELDFYNLDNVPQNYQILSDKIHMVDSQQQRLKYFSLHLNDMNVKTRYQGVTSAYTDISTNAIFMLVVSQPLDGTSATSVRINSRIRYVDN